MHTIDPERLLASEVAARDATDYRFRWGSYIGWTILTFGLYAHYGTYRLVQRRVDHAKRRLAFSAGLWHVLAARAKAVRRLKVAQPGLDNLSRIHSELETYERSNKRNAALLVIVRLVTGGGLGAVNFVSPAADVSDPSSSLGIAVAILALVFAVLSGSIGAYINHVLNRDLRFFETWEDSMAEQAGWVLGRIGSPVAIPARSRRIPRRDTALYVFLTVITAGLFAIWWRYSMMRDGNEHFEGDDQWEDRVVHALGIRPDAIGPPLPPRG